MEWAPVSFGLEAAPNLCAQPASVVCTDDWKWVIPVLALILGFALRWVQENLSEGKRQQSQRLLRQELRLDHVRMQRSDAERANLLALQQAVAKYYLGASEAHGAMLDALGINGVWARVRMDHAVNGAIQSSKAEMTVLQYRIHAAKVCIRLDDLIDEVTAALKAESLEVAEENWKRADISFANAQRLIGAEIRRLEDDAGQQAELDSEQK